MRPDVSLSTSSVFPEHTADGFALGAELGYDGIEIMVGLDAASSNVAYLSRLADQYSLHVVAIHAPCLLLTQNVWGPDHWDRVVHSCEAAMELGADTVVLHPPLRWQRDYASRFVDGVRQIAEDTGITIAVENMYPWRNPGRNFVNFQAYLPSWDPTELDYESLTLDVSHAATSQRDALEMAKEWGPRLRHVHLTDGVGSMRDEHLLPGEGSQKTSELMEYLVDSGFDGHIVLEVNTRKAADRAERKAMLASSLQWTRQHLSRLTYDAEASSH